MKYRTSMCAGLLTVLAGCGPTPTERALQTPEMKQRLLELEKEREAQQTREMQRLEEIKSSADVARRVNEELIGDVGKQPKETPPPIESAETKSPRPAPRAPAGNPPPPAQRHAGWGELRAGLSTDAVRKLLGPPTTTSQDVALMYWHYGSGKSAGRVAFLSASGQLLAWEAPLR